MPKNKFVDCAAELGNKFTGYAFENKDAEAKAGAVVGGFVSLGSVANNDADSGFVIFFVS